MPDMIKNCSVFLYFALSLFNVSNLLSVETDAQAMRPMALLCEYLENPLGIESSSPRLSWKMPSHGREQRQSAYQVIVASTRENLHADKGDLWNSEKIDSDQSIFIPYSGKSLTTGQQCFWKVRVWDKVGQASDWSDAAQWSMGLLETTDWTAKWIGKDEVEVHEALTVGNWIWYPESEPADAVRFFRKAVDIPKGRVIKSARLTIAADNMATVFCNGVNVGLVGSTSIAKGFNVAAFLEPGRNLLSFKVENKGDSNNPAGLLAVLTVKFDSGPPLEFTTDGTWKVAKDEGKNWKDASFDDSDWRDAKVVAEVGAAPWGETRQPTNRQLPARMLRTEFQVDRPVRRAYVVFSGLGLSELHLNGVKVSDDVLSPGLTDYTKRVLYVMRDVTELIQNGGNAIGVVLGNGRFFAPRLDTPTDTVTYGYPKLILQLHIEYVDGTVAKEVLSGESWKLTTKGPIRHNNEYDGEDYDARLEMSGWSKSGFDDSLWENARLVDAPSGVLSAQSAPPIRIVETIPSKTVKEVRPGVYVVDMGQNMVGWGRIRVSGSAGEEITLRYAESLNPDGSIYVANLRDAAATDRYILSGNGSETWEPKFTYHGFRYVEITGWPGKFLKENLVGCVVNDDVKRAGEFSCSEDMINRIYKNVVWGVQGNYRSIPTDCPQRDERQGWLGDRAEGARGEAYLFDVNALYAKWSLDIVDAQKASGSIPDVVPPYWPIYNDNVSWPSTVVFIPAMLLDQYGDREVVKQRYAAMVKWVDYMNSFVQDNIIAKDSYGDWCVPPEDAKMIHSLDPERKTAPEIIATSYYYHCLQLMARFAKLVDKPEDEKRFAETSQKLKTAFNDRFFDKEKGYYGNGSQTSCILPLSFGMVPQEYRSEVFQRLVHKVVEENRRHIGTGLVGGQWINRALTEGGRPDLSYGFATNTTYPSWGYMVEQGATTIWELWNGNTADPAMNSGNHVMLVGDLVTWLNEDVAGIRPDTNNPGFKHILMQPQPVGDLNWVRATHNSPYGLIESSWKIESDEFAWAVTIPPNTTATVWIPCSNPEFITESGAPLAKSKGITVLESEAGYTVCSLSSGQFKFKSPWKKAATGQVVLK